MDVTAASDIYSLGAVAYFLLTGGAPFAGRPAMQMMAAHLYEKPRALTESVVGMTQELSDLIARCLEKSPDARFAAMGELEEALRGSVSAADWTAAQARDWWSDQRKVAADPASAA